MIKTIFILLSVIFLSGCVTTTTPPMNEFRVNSNLSFSSLSEGKCHKKSLKVAEAFSSNSLKSLKMKYAYGNNKQFIYSQSQWALSPNQAITSEIINLLRDLELFSSVQIAKSRSRNDMLLEISIDEFMQYFNEDGSRSYVNVVLSLTLLDTKTKTIFATKTFRQKSDVKRLNAEGGVESLNTALRTVLLSSSIWFEEICR